MTRTTQAQIIRLFAELHRAAQARNSAQTRYNTTNKAQARATALIVRKQATQRMNTIATQLRLLAQECDERVEERVINTIKQYYQSN